METEKYLPILPIIVRNGSKHSLESLAQAIAGLAIRFYDKQASSSIYVSTPDKHPFHIWTNQGYPIIMKDATDEQWLRLAKLHDVIHVSDEDTFMWTPGLLAAIDVPEEIWDMPTLETYSTIEGLHSSLVSPMLSLNIREDSYIFADTLIDAMLNILKISMGLFDKLTRTLQQEIIAAGAIVQIFIVDEIVEPSSQNLLVRASNSQNIPLVIGYVIAD